jgi:predicted nucleic acid-binding protein
MKQVFLDTNVILDLLTDRHPFVEEAAQLFSEARQGAFKLHVCSLSFPNIHYLIERHHGKGKAMEAMRLLSPLVSILSMDAASIQGAITRQGPDFEDDIQLECALAAGMDVIVTRDPRGFKNAQLPVMSPETFLKTLMG